MKDPAFLLYSKDFQSGTQDMSCEELGAYFRLLLYQHQNEKIPADKERLMRITGIFIESKFDQIWKMVSQKFDHSADHLVNQRLNQEMTIRSEYKPKKIASATLAGLISTVKNLTFAQKNDIKKSFKINDFVALPIEQMKEKIKEWFSKTVDQMLNQMVDQKEEEMVDQMVDYLANANANANANGIKDRKGGMGEREEEISKEAKIVIDRINEITGSEFQHTKNNAKGINARLEDGHVVQTLIEVVEMKCFEWLKNPEMQKHLNPETLFRPTKFPKYIEQLKKFKSDPKLQAHARDQFNNPEQRRSVVDTASALSAVDRMFGGT